MDYMPMSAHTLVDFGISNAPLSDIDISIFQPFIRHEYLKDQPVPSQPQLSQQSQQHLQQQQQQLQLYNVTLPDQPLPTGAGPPSQFPLSPPISFSDYETLPSPTPEDCYNLSTVDLELQASEEDGSTQGCQESERATLNTVAAPPVNWSDVVPWVSTKPPSRGRPRGTKRKSSSAAAQHGESVEGATGAKAAKPGAKRGRKPRASRQQTANNKSLGNLEDDKTAIKEAKAAHSVVERRYRDNLNGKMSQLYYVLREVNSPGPHSRLLGVNSGGGGGGSGSSGIGVGGEATIAVPSFQPPSRVRKSEILNSAIDYIHQSEVEMRHMADEIKHLQDKERTIRNLVKCEEWSVLRALMGA